MVPRLAAPQALIRRPVAALVTQWPRAAADEVEGIHQVRVASRRLREWVPVLVRDPKAAGPASLRLRLREVTRLFGPSRELDVTLLLLAAIAAREPAHAAAAAIVRAHVERERARAGRARRRAGRRVPIEGLAAEALGLAGRDRSPAYAAACAARAAARLDRRARRLHARLVAAGFLFATGPLHLVRIALKRFRYALEVAERLGRFRLAGTMRRLKAMQDLLGDLHDLQVLAAYARDAAALAPPAKRARVEALVADLDGRIRALHVRFVGERGSLVEVLGRATRVRVKLLGMASPGGAGSARARRGRGRLGG